MNVKKNFILKIGIFNISFYGALEEVRKWLKEGKRKHIIFTPNPEIITLAQKNRNFIKILNDADLALPDGSGLVWASRIFGIPLKERISGIDFMERLCEVCEDEGFSIGLIGGEDKVAVKTSECLQKLHPKLKIALAQDWDPEEASLKLRHWKTPIDVLFVAYGQWKQEKWIAENLDKIPVKVAMGVGGAFDYLSGKVPRAPKFMRDHGLEWLFRLVRQPWRIKRQIVGGQFFLLVLREWFKKKFSDIKN